MAKKKKLFITFVLDETGSMDVCRSETISGFNEYIDTLKKEKKGKVFFTLVQFNWRKTDIVYDSVSLEKVTEMTPDDYRPVSLTPLCDAVGTAIKSTAKAAGDSPVLFIIMTDGEENASREFSFKKVSKMIEKKTKSGWTFVYLGANHDVWSVREKLGLAIGNVASYDQGKTKSAMCGVAALSASYTQSGGVQTDDAWDDAGVDKSDLS